MRTLLILRHAKSSWAVPGQRDFDRELSRKGHQQLEQLARFAREQTITASAALCSPAARTRATFEGIAAALGQPSATFEDRLYNGTVEGYLDILSTADGADVLLVGHNPTCDELVRHLAAPSSPEGERLQASHFATCTLARLRFVTDEWVDLRRGSGTLDLFVTPKMLQQA